MAEPLGTMPIEPASLQTGATGEDRIPTLHAGVTPQSTSQPSATSASSTSTKTPEATGVRQRISSLSAQVDAATDHPVVKNVKVSAQKQVGNLREILGRSPLIVEAERRTKVDRVILVIGGILACVPSSLAASAAQDKGADDVAGISPSYPSTFSDLLCQSLRFLLWCLLAILLLGSWTSQHLRPTKRPPGHC